MSQFTDLLDALDERTIAQQVTRAHDEARMSYALTQNTVDEFDEFSEQLALYYIHHFTTCVSVGGNLSQSDARQRARQLVENAYRQHKGDIVMAFNDAHDGTNGGLRVILDEIADALKAEAVENHISDAFDHFVRPNSWEDRLEIIRQFIDHAHNFLGDAIDPNTPERYARDYKELIRAYADGLRQTSRIFRRF